MIVGFRRLLIILLLIALVGCAAPPAAPSSATTSLPAATSAPVQLLTPTPDQRYQALAGEILIDGSSTVYPITEAIGTAFQSLAPAVHVRIGVSGTGGGFKKFCAGETIISDASRPIKTSEMALCTAHQIQYIELPVAFDGLSVVVNPANTWVDCLTVAELKRLWEPAAEGQLMRWSQLRPAWPDQPIELYGAGKDSGTYDYFTDAIIGTEGVSRPDFIGSEDDYVLVQGVSLTPYALAFFGYAYYLENRSRLKLVGIDNGQGCQTPSEATIASGVYQPLSRPLFIYVREDALKRPEVQAFIDFYLAEAQARVPSVGYIALSAPIYARAAARVAQRKTGTVFQGGSKVGVSLEDLFLSEGL